MDWLANPWLLVAAGWFFMFTVMTALWLQQRRTGNSGIVDVAWSAGVGILAAFFCLASTEGLVARRWIVAALALTWAVRLSWHVWQRVRSEPEDGRYVELKRKWGERAQVKMFRFYQFQAFGAVLFALPMLLAARSAAPLGWLDAIGVMIWVIALVGETIADRQLSTFKANPANRGQVCQTGLWRYSRHPNYFFEWLHWWSYACFALTAPWGWLAVIGPLAMLHFIVNVTGIPPTERQALRSRGEAYRQYQRSTSAFFPWFPQKEAAMTD